MSLMQDVLSSGCNCYLTGKIYSSRCIVGMKMRTYIQNSFFRLSLLLFAGLPLLIICTMNNFPERSLLKEVLSVITILALYQLIGQFYWARTNRSAVRNLTMAKVLRYHKFIGYTFVSVMIFHPLYVVLPRFFEAGVSPADAFITMITTLNLGVVLGLIAWCLMLVLVVTSYLRNKLPMSYKSWRVLHTILAILFMAIAVWHAIDLGRHSNLVMSIVLSLLTAGGIVMLLKTYILKKNIKTSKV